MLTERTTLISTSIGNGDAAGCPGCKGPGVTGRLEMNSDGGEKRFDETLDMNPGGPPSPPPEPPADIEGAFEAEGFEIIEEVGRGGMGVVYKALEKSLRREVALKVLSPSIADNPSSAARFRREAILAANLHHANIVPVFLIDSAEPPRYYTMEFVQGRSLKARVDEDGFLSAGQVGRIAYQALAALGHAHERNIVHRDVKPANIMLEDRTERVRITDFGIAQDITGTLAEVTRTQDTSSIGTPAYMSPEQNLGESMDARSDLFSLGATLYYALTGQLPFRARNRQQLAVAFHQQPVTPPSDVNPDVQEWLDRIVLKMLAIRPEDRYESCQAALRELGSYAGGAAARSVGVPGAPVAASPTSTHTRPVVAPRRGARPVRRWRKMVTVVAGVAVGTVLAILLWPTLSELRQKVEKWGDEPETPRERREATGTSGAERSGGSSTEGIFGAGVGSLGDGSETNVPEPDPQPEPMGGVVEQGAIRQLYALSPPSSGSGRYGWYPAISEKFVVVCAPSADSRRGQAFVYDAATGEFLAELGGDDRVPGDQFGYCAAIDDETIVVGAALDDDGAGSACVFRRQDDDQWRQIAKLTASDRTSNDWFGRSVAIDGNTIIVCAPGKNDGGRRASEPRTGAAYVFQSADGLTWQETARITSPSPRRGEVFGFVAAISGQTLVLGAPALDSDKKGAAYLFRQEGQGRWVEAGQLVAPNARDTSIGYDVAISGNIIMVGHDGDASDYSPRSGAAYLFAADSGELIARLTSPERADGDRFGRHVAIDGQFALVTSHGDGETDYGRAYLFAPDAAGQWHSVVTVIPEDRQRGDNFASSAGLAGNRIIAATHTTESAFVFEIESNGPATGGSTEMDDPSEGKQ